MNSYFIEHPEMVLGVLSRENTQYGRESFTVLPAEGADLADQLHEAIGHIHGVYREASLPDLGEGEALDASIPADPTVRNFSYTVVDGFVYYRENSRMVKPRLKQTAQERVKGLIALRDQVHRLIDAQLDEQGDEEIAQLQRELNTLYDGFSVRFGLINDRANRLAFAEVLPTICSARWKFSMTSTGSCAKRICSPDGPSGSSAASITWTPHPMRWPYPLANGPGWIWASWPS